MATAEAAEQNAEQNGVNGDAGESHSPDAAMLDATTGDLPVDAEVTEPNEAALAAAADHGTATASHTVHKAEPKMPQLNPEYFHSQIFWLVVTFVALWVVMSRSILPRIHTLLENRQNKISHDLDRAEKLGLEAESARENYERALVESRSKAQALIAESAALMEKSSTARHNELSAKLEKQLADAETKILAAKSDALAKLTPVAKELTQDIVEKLTGQKLKAADVAGVVDGLAKENRRG